MALLEVFVADAPPLHTDADGAVRVGGTRVTLDTVIDAYRQGANAEEIALRYDALSLPDVYAVISYYLRHRHEVEEYLRDRKEQVEQVRWFHVGNLTPGLRERLLARRNQSGQI